MEKGFIYELEVDGFRAPSFVVNMCLPGRKVHLSRSRCVFDTVEESWKLLGPCDGESCRHLFVGEEPVDASRILEVPATVMEALLKLDINSAKKILLLEAVRSREVFLNGPEGTNQSRRWIQNI
ncbi:MAG: hypothetical protein AAB736_02885 [Patescibacteria group bacterium]